MKLADDGVYLTKGQRAKSLYIGGPVLTVPPKRL